MKYPNKEYVEHLRRKYQSLNVCLEHLDVYVGLRGPKLSPGITAAQQAIWRELEVVSEEWPEGVTSHSIGAPLDGERLDRVVSMLWDCSRLACSHSSRGEKRSLAALVGIGCSMYWDCPPCR